MMKHERTPGNFLFDTINILILTALCITTIFPFLNIITMAFSPGTISFTKLHIFPTEWTMENINKILTNEYIASGFISTITRTVVGTALGLIMTIFAAYPLSKKTLPNRSFWTSFIVITMFVSGGMIPNYLLVNSLGIMNTVWALVLPGVINTFNMIIARNFFMMLPPELEEAAKIDGANEMLILFLIIIPISMPIIATLFLWIAVGHWNAWFDSMIYTRDARKLVLQVVMRRIVLEGTQQMLDLNPSVNDPNQTITNPETIKAATILVTTLPIIVLYPFLQKYFVKGVMVGSLKG